MTNRIPVALLAASTLALAACVTPATEMADTTTTPAKTATAETNEPTSGEIGRAALKTAAGHDAGEVILYKNGNAISVRAGLSGQPGTYALHIHDVGTCTGPDFTSAGPHWNPTTRKHGLKNPEGHHLGDMPNVVFDANGRAAVSYRIENALALGPNGLFDANGAAVVMHAKADDNVSDPAGNAGDRIACGVINKSI